MKKKIRTHITIKKQDCETLACKQSLGKDGKKFGEHKTEDIRSGSP